MDVDRQNFNWQLPRILRALATAHFVALDFELSGIQSKAAHKAKDADKLHGGKQTLQQRYREVKEAAEKYQILQVGLTIGKEDAETGIYTVRPYNFFLNPILEEKLDIERIFSYQSGAVEFLLSHGFNMAAPFTKGVGYLSREEEVTAVENEAARQDKDRIQDIYLRSDEVEAIKFVRRVREEVTAWANRKSSYPDYINIAPEGHAITSFTERGLNNYQKRLVHQLVRAEFPDLVTISRQGFIQIIKYDEKRENDLKQSRMAGLKEKVSRQVGLRWVVEGMVGGNLGNLNPIIFAKGIEGTPAWIDMRELTRAHEEVKNSLRERRAVLVGHNLFMDLINFYKCFFGQLPDTVEEFQTIIHELFPLVVDTKYMATHQVKNQNPRSGLDEIDADLCKMPVPAIELHKDHPNYYDIVHAHEAGYDSFVTAKILIRLSTLIERTGQYVVADVSDREKKPRPSPVDEGGVLLDLDGGTHSKTTNGYISSSANQNCSTCTQSTGNGVSLLDYTHNPAAVAVKSKPRRSKNLKRDAKKVQTAFSHIGMFDLLGDISADEDGGEIDGEETETEEEPRILVQRYEDGRTMKRSNLRVDEEWDHPTVKMLVDLDVPVPNLMPRWESDFWNHYGNMLRVNGTVEGVCDLLSGAPREAPLLETVNLR